MTWRGIGLFLCATGVATSGAFASELDASRTMYRVIDKATAAEIRVSRPSPTSIRVEVTDGTVVIRRDLQPAASETTIWTLSGGDEIRLTDAKSGLTATNDTAIADSAVVRQALQLLARVSTPVASPIGQSLLATRARLLSAAGDVRGAEAVLARGRAALEELIDRAATEPEDEGDLDPTQCWEAYAHEAIAAYMEYEDCMSGCAWYNPFCPPGCATIYDMRAIGAFAWWLRCVGLGVRS